MSPLSRAITVLGLRAVLGLPAGLGLPALLVLTGVGGCMATSIPGSSMLEDGGRFLTAAKAGSRAEPAPADEPDLLARRRHQQCLALEEQITDGQFSTVIPRLRQLLVELEQPHVGAGGGVPDATGEFAPRLRFWLAYCHEELGEASEARSLYDEVVMFFSRSRWARLAQERLAALGRGRG